MSEVGTWTEERVELLKKLWNDGLSASQIAGELGSVTRNAVIGKVHRLGLSGRAKAPSSSTPRPRKTVTRAPSHPMSGGGGGNFTRGNTALQPQFQAEVEASPEVEPAPSEDVVIPFSERVTIMELRESMCRWPMGDPSTAEFRYCGGKSNVGMPYCTYHAKIAYQPAADRRRDRDRRVARG
ncbi:MAG: GcrA family cell cycle regulator [Bosea sp. (in: a-proteobacteria)]